MEEGTLRVDIEKGTVEIFCRIKKVWRQPYIMGDDPDPTKSYSFVRIYHRGKRKLVALHRLIWMVANAVEFIPDGYEIDHEDDNIHNNHHLNLILKTREENQDKRHGYDDF